MVFVIFLQNSQQGSVLVGAISYGKLSFADQDEQNNPEKHPASCRISYVVPPNKVTSLNITVILYTDCTSHACVWLVSTSTYLC